MGRGETDGDFVSVELETFTVMADWYHFAILELATCKGFKSSGDYIARKLKISVAESNAAVRRLLKLGLLTERKGRIVKTEKYLSTPTDLANQALRHFHSQMIHKAVRSLEEEAVQNREITGLTFAVDPEILPKAKAEVQKFLRRMAKLTDSTDSKQVMQLNVQLFPLSEPSTEVSK